jgi:sugar/nucleoside kinase (ribokinase family)
MSITNSAKVESALKLLARQAKLVIVKLGADGALAYHDNEIAESDSIPVNVVDTVGAGDSFDAGFLYGYLNNWQLV